jgi:hypothetical protein
VKRSSLLYQCLLVVAAASVLYYVGLLIDTLGEPARLSQPMASASNTSPYYGIPFRLICALVITPCTIAVGVLVSRRVRGNPLGPILVIWGAAIANIALGSANSIYFQVFFPIVNNLGFRMAAFLAFFYPNGSVYPPRFTRWVHGWVLLTLVIAIFVPITAPHWADKAITYPFFVPALAGLYEPVWAIFGLSLAMSFLLGALSVFLRYRQGSELEKLQIRWLMLGVFSFVLITFSWDFMVHLLTPPFDIYFVFVQFVVYGFPALAIGNAILRYRLYDIDIIIRRTLIYAILTGILAAVYFGVIILTQQLFRAATGQTSDLAIVVSTLLIAALFTPIRRRVQDGIDRRLYRRKYDVEQTLADFQKNLRDDVDMATLQANLIHVVSDTMQPDKIALWVRSGSENRL